MPLSLPSAAALIAALISSTRGVALGHELEIDDRDIGHRHADRGAVETALQFRNDKADGLGGTRRRRDHRHGGGAAAVEILVHGVEGRLVAGIGVDRRHEAVVDADRVVEHEGHRRQAVGGAGRIRDDDVVLGQLVVVDAIDDGEVGAIGGGRDDDALGAGGQMRRGLVLRGEDAGAFERDVDAQILPRQLRSGP